MGAWLSTIQIHTDNRKEVLEAAAPIAAEISAVLFVGAVRRGWVPLITDFRFAREAIAALVRRISAPIFFCVVADDDDFRYEFYRNGQRVDRYSSQPEAYGDDIPLTERSEWCGRPETFADLLGSPAKVKKCRALLAKNRDKAAPLEAILAEEAKDDDDDADFVFESERLARFGALLGFGQVHVAYDDFERTDGPGLRRRFTRVPDDAEAKSAKRLEIAQRKAVYRQWQKDGSLLADFRPPATKVKYAMRTLAWAQNPHDRSLLVRWGTFGYSAPPFLYSAADFKTILPLPQDFPDHFDACAFSNSGRYFAAALHHPVNAISIREWPDREVGQIPFLGATALQFGPGDRVLYIASHGELVAVGVPDLCEIGRVPLTGDRPSFALDPSGAIGVFGSHDGSLLIRELPSMRELKRLVVHGGFMGGQVGALAAFATELQAMAKDPAIKQLQETIQEQCKAGIPKDRAAMKTTLNEMLRVSSELQNTVRERMKQSGLAEQLNAQSVAFQANLATAVAAAGGATAFARSANPERFTVVQFSPDGVWLFAASNLGVRAWRWAALHAIDGAKAPPPEFQCEARPDQNGHGTYCYALAYDAARQRLLFAGLEGIVEYLDLATGATGTLLRPPELLAILRLVLSSDGQTLITESRELKRNSPAPHELRVWNYPALCAGAGLPG